MKRRFWPTLVCIVAAPLSFGLAACAADCDSMEAEASQMVQDAQACAVDQDCKLINTGTLIPDSCLLAFQCSNAVNVKTDEADFIKRATRLSARFKLGCTVCTQAKCAGAKSARCNTAQGRCEVVPSV